MDVDDDNCVAPMLVEPRPAEDHLQPMSDELDGDGAPSTSLLTHGNFDEEFLPEMQSDAANKLGEFDVAWPFWARYLQEHMNNPSHCITDPGEAEAVPVLLISTLDTDLMFISTMACAYKTEAVKDIQVRVRFDTGSKRDLLWFNASSAPERIQAIFGGGRHKESANCPQATRAATDRFLRAAVFAGSDFTQPWPRVAHTTFLQSASQLVSPPQPDLHVHCEDVSLSKSKTAGIVKELGDLKRLACQKRGANSSGDACRFNTHVNATCFVMAYWQAHVQGNSKPERMIDPTQPQGGGVNAAFYRLDPSEPLSRENIMSK